MLAIALILRNTVGFSRRTFAGLVVALSLTTPVAFFASYLMPDLFAGVTILGVAALLVYSNEMTRGIWLAWVGLLCAALLMHSSHVLIAVSLLGVGLIGRFLFHASVSTKGMIGIVVSLVVAFAGDVIFTVGTSKMFGITPIRPPFLMARLIADGPGEAFLRDQCPHENFTVCHFMDRMPISTAHVFLWSADPRVGVFSVADGATKRALADEQFRFAYAVLRFDPMGVARAALRNTFDQLVMVSLSEFNLNDDDRQTLLRSVPERHLRHIENTKGWADTLPVGVNRYVVINVAQGPGQQVTPQTPGGWMPAIVLIVLLTSLASVVGFVALRDRGFRCNHDLRSLAVVTLLGILVNAFVCGALSEPYERYQARVVWLIPLLAGLIYFRLRQQAGAVETSPP
jgi:hypothetical protein